MMYDYLNNEFSDGTWIEWLIFEPIENITICSVEKPPMYITKEYLDAKVLDMEDVEYISVPIRRHKEFNTPVITDVPIKKTTNFITVCDLFTTIYDFYQSPVILDDLKDKSDDCVLDAINKIHKGANVKFYQLLGSDRQTFNGLFRFMGFYVIDMV